jgi:hypothetical protein
MENPTKMIEKCGAIFRFASSPKFSSLAIRRTIDSASKADLARLLDSVIDRVIPRFEVKVGKDKKRRAFARGFEFVPRQTTAARNILPQAMEICANRTDRGLSSPPERTAPGRISRTP